MGKLDLGKTFDFIEYYLRFATTLNAVPFTYDRQTRRFAVKPWGLKYTIWLLLMPFCISGEWIQMSTELVRGRFDPEVSRGYWSLVCFLFISWTLIATCHWSVACKYEKMVNHMNQAIRVREWLAEGIGMPQSNFYKVVRAHICSSSTQFMFQSLMVAAEGTRRHFLYSNVPVQYRNLYTSMFWAAWAYYRVATNFLSGYFQVMAGVLHVQTCNQVLAARSAQQQRLTLEQKLKIYRMLQILTNRYAEAYSGFFIPEFTAFIAENFILGIYGSVKFYDDEIGFQNYINFPLMVIMMFLLLFTFYPNMATLYETTLKEPNKVMEAVLNDNRLERTRNRVHVRVHVTGEQVLETGSVDGSRKRSADSEHLIEAAVNQSSRKGRFSSVSDQNRVCRVDQGRDNGAGDGDRRARGDLKYARSVARSCPTVGVPFGSLYKIKRTTVLSIFDFIACNSISAFITFR